jgi:LmbE family N-acetylglucosaminyl deacetylase
VVPLRLAPPGRRLTLLCLGAHADDIEIGCGGTVLQLASAGSDVACRWVVFGAVDQRADEARASAALFLAGASDSRVDVHPFRDGYFPSQIAEIKDVFEFLKRDMDPDIVFTHYRRDRHQDHRVISDLTWQTFRDHLVLEYEVPKYDGDLGIPNLFVPLAEPIRHRKIEYLMTVFATQRSKRWFTEDTFSALTRLRGIESGATEGHAEAFYARKLRLNAGFGC